MFYKLASVVLASATVRAVVVICTSMITAVLSSNAARTATITAVVSGIMIPDPNVSPTQSPPYSGDGIDYAGIFGPAGGSLVGAQVSVTWTGSDCNCPGGAITPGGPQYFPNPDPIIDAVLTINGINYHFGSGYFGDFFLIWSKSIRQLGHMLLLTR